MREPATRFMLAAMKARALHITMILVLLLAQQFSPLLHIHLGAGHAGLQSHLHLFDTGSTAELATDHPHQRGDTDAVYASDRMLAVESAAVAMPSYTGDLWLVATLVTVLSEPTRQRVAGPVWFTRDEPPPRDRLDDAHVRFLDPPAA